MTRVGANVQGGHIEKIMVNNGAGKERERGGGPGTGRLQDLNDHAAFLGANFWFHLVGGYGL